MLLAEYWALLPAQRIAAAKTIAANMNLLPTDVYGALAQITVPEEIKCQLSPPLTPCIIKPVVNGKKQATPSTMLALSQFKGGR